MLGMSLLDLSFHMNSPVLVPVFVYLSVFFPPSLFVSLLRLSYPPIILYTQTTSHDKGLVLIINASQAL